MPEESKHSSGELPAALPLVAVLVLLAGWFFVNPPPYKEERPSVHPLQAHLPIPAAQDVEARLWQDPFAAVNDANETSQKSTFSPEAKNPLSDRYRHDWERIYSEHPEQNSQSITIIAVTIAGGSYQEAAEQRMRWRYAVLSALANRDFSPQDEQHIGYVNINNNMFLQKKLPFEWWSRSENKGAVLLLWVDESSLRKDPAKKLKELLFNASPESANTPKQVQYKVIGPNFSTTLRVLLKEFMADEKNFPIAERDEKKDASIAKDTLTRINGRDIEYFSASATAADKELISDDQLTKSIVESKTSVSNHLDKRGVKLHRIPATDEKLMAVIIEELQKRLFKPQLDKDTKDLQDEHIVILSEWDTFYGQAMPKAFKEKLENNGGNKDNVRQYSYMRGLDGKLPAKADNASNGVDKKTDGKDRLGAETFIELPEGQNQKDYLRRLTANLVEWDQTIKDGDNIKGIFAIGVLGSDLHDKLLILEALRQHFPHKLFFTTDLDAAYSHPAKLTQAHNLLVASAFDLKLRPELQGQIFPFRDSYQTAIFLATQMAINEGVSNKVQKREPLPRLFEIGRSKAIPLSTAADVENNNVFTDIDYKIFSEKNKCSWDKWTECKNIVQPPLIISSYFSWTRSIIFAVFLAALAPLLISYSVRKIWKEYMFSFAILFLSFLFFVPRWNHYIIQADAEPFFWLERVSAWPSQLLRLLDLLFVTGFFWWGHKRIQKTQSDLEEKPSLYNQVTIFALPKSYIEIGWWDKLMVGNWKENYVDKPTCCPDQMWEKYLSYGRPKFAFLRILLHFFLFIGIAILVISNDPPNTPTRGVDAGCVNTGLLIAVVFATIFLTMWVVENARLCERLIYNLSQRPSRWNSIACDWAEHKQKVARECVHEWLDIQLVFRLTESLQPLIWGPMVSIFLLVLARSPVIDDWGIPWGLGITLLVMLLYAVSAEIFLQRGASYARSKAIEQLTGKIIAQSYESQPDMALIKHIEDEVERIKMLRKGAFSPWYKWPLLQSIGGLSTLVYVVQYFARVWEKGAF